MRNQAGMHPPAGDHLDDIEDLLPISEHIKDRGHGSYVGRKGAEPDQMTGNTEKFRQHNPDNSCPLRHGDAAEPFDTGHIGQIVLHPGQIVDSIGVRDKFVPVLPLADLFRSRGGDSRSQYPYRLFLPRSASA